MTKPELVPVGCITEVHTKTAFGGTVGIIPQMYGFLPVGTLLYTAPPKKEWVGLTDEEIGTLTVFYGLHYVEVPLLANFARAVEAKLKEKNT